MYRCQYVTRSYVLCARMRRGALNNFAADNNYTKLALGHNLDDAVETFTSLIHEASFLSAPVIGPSHELGLKVRASATAREMIRQSRRLRRIWHRTRNPRDKANWNLAIKLCSEFLAKERNTFLNTQTLTKKISLLK